MSARRTSRRREGPRRAAERAGIVGTDDASLLDLLDNVLTRGIVVSGDVVVGLADVDLLYLRLSVLLCAADRVLGPAAKKRRRR
jgi:hypothetical protein